ncbi:MAG: type II secretion system F family protein [Chitinivibrionales bacterium]|nr:type II secretion system F family protein [Chitinivibrionales bacterium]MBD3356201.1 type II secretion system F family protein [Chitinivibrionales bacterium]
MAKYEYTCVTSSGKQVRGEVQAGNRDEVISLLRKRKLRVVSVKRMMGKLKFQLTSQSVRLQDMSRFTRQFAAMTSAGLPLIQCMDILANQTENKTLADAVRRISADIQGGSSLAEAMGRHPKIFSSLYCNMITAGEASGNLDGVLLRLAEHQEKSHALRRKIKGAMTYPAILGTVSVGVTALMLTFVVPRFAEMFVELGGELPVPTRIVMAISNVVQKYFFWGVGVIIALFVGITRAYKTEKGAFFFDSVKLRLPIMGDLERKSAISRFSQTLATLLSSGVSILEALSITAKTAGNKVLERGLFVTLEKITGGQTIAEPLTETGIFPPMVTHMIAVGERTGDLSSMLTKISQFYEEEVDAAVDALTSVLEPVMIVILGIVIGGILIAMYLPMFDMINQIS